VGRATVENLVVAPGLLRNTPNHLPLVSFCAPNQWNITWFTQISSGGAGILRDHRGFEEDTAVQRRLASRDDGFEEKGEEGVKSEGMERIGFSNNHLEVVKIRKKLMWSEARRTNLHSKDFIFAVSPRMFHPLPPYPIVTCDCLGPVRYSLASLVNQFFKFSSIKQLHP